ncbi:MAG: rhodanese-like domain-containing protein [Alistipes sp.]|nr:rhodanese-like domain-containing protein [Alistipes sp.]
MKHYIFILLAICLAFASNANAQAGVNKIKIRSYSSEQFSKQIRNPKIIVVDVRTAKEYNEGHIAEADLNIDVLKSNFAYHAHRELPRNRTIALYCKGGVRSKRAAKILMEYGYKVFDLDKGYDDWVKAGMPTEKTTK